MSRAKGCLNKRCEEYKKTYYKESDMFCVKCGTELSYVCKHHKCFKQLPDDTNDKYCLTCLSNIRDKRDERNKKIKQAGIGFLGVGATVVTIAKAVDDYIRNK